MQTNPVGLGTLNGMRKSLVLFAAIALLGVSISSPASAAIKAGAKCAIKGQTKTSQGKKFTCVQSGKKLSWDKGATVSKSVANPSPSPSPTSSSAVESVGASTESAKAQEISAVSINNLNAKDVYARSRQEVEVAIRKSDYENSFFNFNIGPNQVGSVVSEEKESLSKAARLWSNVYQPKEQVEVLFYNFIDLEWAKSKYSQITGAQTFRSADSCSPNYCGGATSGRTGTGPWIYEQGLGGTLWNKSTSAHEYTHLAQTSGNPDYWNIAPLWLVEGMAQFYGEAIGYVPFDSKKITRGEIHRQYSSDFKSANQGDMKTLLAKNDVSTIKSLMESVEFPNPRHAQATTAAAYLLGSYTSEALVAVFGHSSVEKFITSFEKSNDWKSNFLKSFGLSSEDFYSKLTPYLYEMSNEL